ncbi:DUF2802 domain-containing protein [Chromatiaceae bacterium AAb-1]|nr:DUF2802 domain-containing protein [Chromatiaceae bacterium AAb-1]
MWWWFGLPAVISCLLLILVYMLLQRQLKRQQQQYQILSRQLELSQQQFGQNQTETEELRSGIIGVGQRVLAIESRQEHLAAELAELAEKQQALELIDPESKIYSRAAKMVQLGADLEEIMRECELPRAEAELLFNLHQQKKT